MLLVFDFLILVDDSSNGIRRIENCWFETRHGSTLLNLDILFAPFYKGDYQALLGLVLVTQESSTAAWMTFFLSSWTRTAHYIILTSGSDRLYVSVGRRGSIFVDRDLVDIRRQYCVECCIVILCPWLELINSRMLSFWSSLSFASCHVFGPLLFGGQG